MKKQLKEILLGYSTYNEISFSEYTKVLLENYFEECGANNAQLEEDRRERRKIVVSEVIFDLLNSYSNHDRLLKLESALIQYAQEESILNVLYDRIDAVSISPVTSNKSRSHVTHPELELSLDKTLVKDIFVRNSRIFNFESYEVIDDAFVSFKIEVPFKLFYKFIHKSRSLVQILRKWERMFPLLEREGIVISFLCKKENFLDFIY
ncbi:MAG: hypothetical protein ACRC26_10820 [Bacteroidales bacterium]